MRILRVFVQVWQESSDKLPLGHTQTHMVDKRPCQGDSDSAPSQHGTARVLLLAVPPHCVLTDGLSPPLPSLPGERNVANRIAIAMAKAGKKEKGASVPSRPIYSRINYMYQAAAHLGHEPAHASSTSSDCQSGGAAGTKTDVEASKVTARYLVSTIKAAALKAQIRLSPEIKRSLCRFCDSFLIEGDTCTSIVENNSKGGKKPWADVLVIKCKACGGVKRFPVQPRQKKLKFRQQEQKARDAAAEASAHPEETSRPEATVVTDEPMTDASLQGAPDSTSTSTR